MGDTSPNIAALLPAVGTDLVIKERPVPIPGSDEVLIHNHAIGLNPIDWKRQAWGFMVSSYPTILGADVCGVVVWVGSSVKDFRAGDRVVGLAGSFSSGNIDHAAHQTYTLVKATRAGKIPEGTSFEEGAAVVTAVGAASMAYFDVLGFSLPTGMKKNLMQPAEPASPTTAVLVWGGSSNVGAMAIQLGRLLGLTVFATASEQHHDHIRSLGASAVFDYRSSTVVDDLLAAARDSGKHIVLAIDAISQPHTLGPASQVLAQSPGDGSAKKKFAHLTPWPQNFDRPVGIEVQQVESAHYFTRRDDLAAWLYNDTLATWLQTQTIVPGRFRVIRGLSGIQGGLDEIKKGVSREKLVVRV